MQRSPTLIIELSVLEVLKTPPFRRRVCRRFSSHVLEAEMLCDCLCNRICQSAPHPSGNTVVGQGVPCSRFRNLTGVVVGNLRVHE